MQIGLSDFASLVSYTSRTLTVSETTTTTTPPRLAGLDVGAWGSVASQFLTLVGEHGW